MGISSNQARFLALTSRQVDLEFRIQQICQRRLRLSSELENVATSYNNMISNRQLYTMNSNNSGINTLAIGNGTYGITSLKDTNGDTYKVLGKSGSSYYVANYYSDATTNQIQLKDKEGGTFVSAINATDLGLTINSSESEVVDAALRAGLITIGAKADEYTQSPTPVNITGTQENYELKDWRTIPSLADELNGSDDVSAENKYDNTITEINAQDKKLQLEQTSIETEYKAVTSEKDSVKKILETNATASFKYFS